MSTSIVHRVQVVLAKFLLFGVHISWKTSDSKTGAAIFSASSYALALFLCALVRIDEAVHNYVNFSAAFYGPALFYA